MNDNSTSTKAFLHRFRNVSSRKRRVELGQMVVQALLLLLLGLGALATADYALEWSRPMRLAGLSTIILLVAVFSIRASLRTMRNWGQRATAAEIESSFPELGQSVRTTIEFSALGEEQIQSAGVATTLVAALAEQTHQRALPLTIEEVVPSRRLKLVLGAVGAGALLLAAAAAYDWQWWNALQRAVLNERPYRELTVRPGDQTVDEGGGVQVNAALIGRTDREVLLFTRPAGRADAEWTERTLLPEPQSAEPDQGGSKHRPSQASLIGSAIERPSDLFVAKLDRLTRPLEYRVTAGELSSPVYHVDIRRPVGIADAKVELTPPAYTGQPTDTSRDLNLNALQGTVARFEIQFDKPIQSAELVFAPRKRTSDDESENPPEVIPLRRLDSASPRTAEVANQGTVPPDATADSASSTSPIAEPRATVTVTLPLNEDRNYSIVATAEDGTVLAETKYRIRIREDQPPQLSFEEPDESIEVHMLAELLMRVRVRDDYGLSKAGVVFQINNEQEVPLISENFQQVVDAAKEVAANGRISPTTQIALEKILPLEYFELTQKDSVMYYAFAEDNRPDKPQRTESDMRFIDIRPFKRTYQVIDPDPANGMGAGSGLKSLEELIQRQRFALNRTLQIEKRAAVGRKPDVTVLDQLMQFETELAKNVRDTAQGLEARGFDDTELYYQAEAAMLQAVDSLSVGKWENATLQMRDALKALIEQRDRTRESILKNPDPARLAALRAFDRMQAQKLRRPKTDKEEARELIRRLEELVNQETAIAGQLADETGEKPNDPPAENKPVDASNEPQKE